MSEAPDTGTPAPEAEAPESSPLGVPAEGTDTGTSTEASSDTNSTPEGTEGADTTAAPDALTPESYDLKLPDDVTVDEAAMTSFKQTLVEAKVAPEVAQSLLDYHVTELKKSADAFATAQAASWAETTDAWKAAVNADPELGGTNKAAVTATIAQALDEYGSLEARQAFDLTGVGWNPAIIKFIYKMASALGEGTSHPAPGPTNPNRTRTPADVLYPPDKET